VWVNFIILFYFRQLYKRHKSLILYPLRIIKEITLLEVFESTALKYFKNELPW